ncbi:unnamed protein product [Cylindrotheca closterium]|uniref:Uncharacterized protein n=1 Tax=Cylindrotheca closterium TaxID=2856 RepID=A0AAD2CJ26_9STRA|nr:unnamed protein product [Cylindrotheca closterium]
MDKEPPTSSTSETKGSDESSTVPSTVDVPAASSHFRPIEGGEENFAGRQGTSSSSGDSSEQSSKEKETKKKRAAVDSQVSATTSLTDSESSSELPKREREKRRRIDYLSTAKGGLKKSNVKLAEENKRIRDAIKNLKEQKGERN